MSKLEYSAKEEKLNALSHSLGVIFSLFVMWDLFHQGESVAAHISTLVYGISIFTLFLASTLYHASISERRKAFFKKCDHCAIYILIAGTYTPFLLLSLNGAWSWGPLIFIWLVALIGVIYKALIINGSEKISLATYLLMGWFAVVIVYPLYLNLDINALYWLVAGGLLYSLGTLFYSTNRIAYNHAIWHLFVVAGCVCHYVAITKYVY